MKFSFSPARLAVLGLAAWGGSVSAQAVSDAPAWLAEVVVTASRVPQDPSLMPQGVVVITADQIQSAGVATANEAIRWLGGVVSRVDTTGGRDPALDLRGFGETASSNVVYLVDGVRQNEGDSSGVALSWIPVESIERIEILRGSGSVLYGEGATGGVINVITSKGLSEPGGSASMTIGSHATRDVRASVRTATGPWRFQLHANAFDTDNHRDNFQRQERNVLARATWAEASTLWSLQLGGQSAQGGLPGGITPADFFSNPQKTYKPRDAGQSEKRNVLLSGEMPAGDWRMGLDLSRRMDDTDSSYIADGYSTQSKTRAKRVSARLWKDFGQGEVRQRLLLGADFERWSQNRDLGDTLVEQASDAFYARHELELRPMGLKVSAGLRQTQAARDIRGSAVGSLEADNTSWDFGAAVKSGERGEWFARLGTSFRLPNADEFACYPYPSGPDCPPVTLLKPQTSSDKELGYREQFAQGRWSVRYYRSDLKNEIGYDPNLGNTNFDPTRREGLELEGNTMWGKSVEVGAQFARRSAVFRSGDYVGKTVPMVPTQTLTARIGYRLTENRRLALATQWVSAQRITEDFNNSCAVQIPSYAVTNLRYSEKVQDWTLAASILNLADRQYYNYRTMCSASLKSVYPEAGRTFMLSAQRHF